LSLCNATSMGPPGLAACQCQPVKLKRGQTPQRSPATAHRGSAKTSACVPAPPPLRSRDRQSAWLERPRTRGAWGQSGGGPVGHEARAEAADERRHALLARMTHRGQHSQELGQRTGGELPLESGKSWLTPAAACQARGHARTRGKSSATHS